MRITPATELEHRSKRLQSTMAASGIDAVIIVQNADLFYFTGSIQSGLLYVPVSGQPLYLVRRHAGRARMESGLANVVPFISFRDLLSVLSDFGYSLPKQIGMELDLLPVNLFERLKALFPEAQFHDASPSIRIVRMIKSAYEIHLMMDAGLQVDKVYRHACEAIRVGITDLELAAELESVARKEGHLGLIRMRLFNGEMLFGHTFSGADSAVPTYTDTPMGGVGMSPAFAQGASGKPILAGEPIVVDFAGSQDGYLVDQTRIFAIGGLSKRLEQAFEDMCVIQSRMEELVVKRPLWGELYDECRAMALDMGYADHFMGCVGSQVSFIGHGLGIEIDEYPFIAKGFSEYRMEPGMVWAFEPKVIFPGEGAVGIENTYYLADDGSLKRLTVSPDKLVLL